MREILLDASGWNKIGGFYGELLPALGAPAYHGPDVNALNDSIMGGNMNTIEPPFVIKIYNTDSIDRKVLDHILLAKETLALTRAEMAADPMYGRDVDATIEIC